MLLMVGKGKAKLNLSVNKRIIEAIDREKGEQTRSDFVSNLIWYAIMATPDEMSAIDKFVEATSVEQ